MPDAAIDQRTALPVISRPLLALFRTIVRRYFHRQFHGVRLGGGHHLDSLSGPLIIYANHSSWWDPMIAYLLASALLPQRAHYAPMDAAALVRYGILRRIGVFPVEMGTRRGAAQFLRTGQAVLRSGAVLWVTPQGQFADPRQRPLVFKPGIAALAARLGRCTLVPLAIEYTFWDERFPEALLLFGDPVQVTDINPESLEPRLITALEDTMEALKQRALTRNPEAFERTLSFRAPGAGGLYALAQRLRAFTLRRPYVAEHTPTRGSGAIPQGPQ